MMKRYIVLIGLNLIVATLFAQVFISENKLVLPDGSGPVLKVINYPEGTLSELIAVKEPVSFCQFDQGSGKLYAAGAQHIMTVDLATKEATSLKVHDANPKVMCFLFGLSRSGIAIYKEMDMNDPLNIKHSLKIYDCRENRLLRTVPYKGNYAIAEDDGYIGEFDYKTQKRSYSNDEVIKEYYVMPDQYVSQMKATGLTSTLVNMGQYLAIFHNKDASSYRIVYIDKKTGEEKGASEASEFPSGLYSIFYMTTDLPYFGLAKTTLGPQPPATEPEKYQQWINDRMNPDNNYIELYENIEQKQLLKKFEKTNGMTFISSKVAMIVRKNTFDIVNTTDWNIVCSVDRF